MPIFEYVCQQCEDRFELLVNSSTKIACPRCDSAQVTKQFSVFAVGKAGGAPAPRAPAGCGSCGDPRGPGSCKN